MKQYDIDAVDLKDKVVRLVQRYFKAGLKAEDHLFVCRGGFGCNPACIGRKIFGSFLSDGEETVITRDCIEAVTDVPAPARPERKPLEPPKEKPRRRLRQERLE